MARPVDVDGGAPRRRALRGSAHGLPGVQEARAAVRVLLDRLSGRYLAGDEEIVLVHERRRRPRAPRRPDRRVAAPEGGAGGPEAVESGGAIRFYRQIGRRMTERSRAITRLLPKALARGELRLHYQPLVDATRAARLGGRGAAALGLRRSSATCRPSEFVPLAEETGLMVPDRRAGCCGRPAGRCAPGSTQGLAPSRRVGERVAVPARARRPRAGRAGGLEETGVDAALLELELSERGVLRADPEILRAAARDPRARRAAGHRRLRHRQLRCRLPQAVPDRRPEDRPVVRARRHHLLRGRGHHQRHHRDGAASSGLRVVAEGVERGRAGRRSCGDHGCTEYQGFLFSPRRPRRTRSRSCCAHGLAGP